MLIDALVRTQCPPALCSSSTTRTRTFGGSIGSATAIADAAASISSSLDSDTRYFVRLLMRSHRALKSGIEGHVLAEPDRLTLPGVDDAVGEDVPRTRRP